MDRCKILDFPLNHTLTIVQLIFRRVVQCESKGVQSAVQRCQGYTVLYLQTCKDLCIVEGPAASDGQPAAQSKLRELRQRAPLTANVHRTICQSFAMPALCRSVHENTAFRG